MRHLIVFEATALHAVFVESEDTIGQTNWKQKDQRSLVNCCSSTNFGTPCEILSLEGYASSLLIAYFQALHFFLGRPIKVYLGLTEHTMAHFPTTYFLSTTSLALEPAVAKQENNSK